MDGDDLSDRLLMFAVRVGKVVDGLPASRLGRHVARQLVRCGTSPLPNYEEARGAESRAEFARKVDPCLRGLRECAVWLRLIAKASLLPEQKLKELIDECRQLVAILERSRAAATQSARRASREKQEP